jgi:Fe-S-cluster containining protein
MLNKSNIIEEVAAIYEWIDAAVSSHRKLTGRCLACGDCCDFEAFDHRLFVTSPELIYLNEKMGSTLKQMAGPRCPYNVNNKCSIYEHRFAGCRIFGCKGNSPFQSQLTESILLEIKLLCNKHEMPYKYTDLVEALNKANDILKELDETK